MQHEVSTIQQYETVSGGKHLLLFSAPAWCKPCQAFGPVWNNLVSENNDTTFVYVNVDLADRDLLDKFQVQSVPTLMLVQEQNAEPLKDLRYFTLSEVINGAS